jgi:hypothetical protein
MRLEQGVERVEDLLDLAGFAHVDCREAGEQLAHLRAIGRHDAALIRLAEQPSGLGVEHVLLGRAVGQQDLREERCDLLHDLEPLVGFDGRKLARDHRQVLDLIA